MCRCGYVYVWECGCVDVEMWMRENVDTEMCRCGDM